MPQWRGSGADRPGSPRDPYAQVVRTGRESRQPDPSPSTATAGEKQDVLVAVCMVFEGRDIAG
jgi:hypothetical protein